MSSNVLIVNELRWSLRRLRMHPAATIAVIAVLTLGIGAAVTVYAVDRAVVLDALPLRAPDRLVVIENRTGDDVGDVMAPADVADLRGLHRVFAGVAAWAQRRAMLGGTANPAYVTAVSVTPDFFATLGASPALGRLDGNSGDVILSWRLWQSQFGSDSSAVGRTTTIDTTTHVVRGVLPP